MIIYPGTALMLLASVQLATDDGFESFIMGNFIQKMAICLTFVSNLSIFMPIVLASKGWTDYLDSSSYYFISTFQLEEFPYEIAKVDNLKAPKQIIKSSLALVLYLLNNFVQLVFRLKYDWKFITIRQLRRQLNI